MGRATDYSNCYIYYILDKDGVVHYVGSTSNMNSRKSSHKYRCNTEHDKQHNLDIYRYIRDNGGFEKFQIVPIRKIENISNKTELRIAEQQEINKFSNLKNMIGSYISEEERAIQHNENSKKFRENNPEYDKKYYEANKEKKSEYYKKYNQENKEKVAENKRKYREANREKINEKRRQSYLKQKELKNADQ